MNQSVATQKILLLIAAVGYQFARLTTYLFACCLFLAKTQGRKRIKSPYFL